MVDIFKNIPSSLREKVRVRGQLRSYSTLTLALPESPCSSLPPFLGMARSSLFDAFI